MHGPCYIRVWHSGVLLGHWKGHSDQDHERWQIWLISYRKCWCSTTESHWSSYLLRFGKLLWHKGQHRHVPYKAACMGVRRMGRVIRLSQTCMLFHQRGKLSLKMWRGPIFGQFYGEILVLSFHLSTQKTLDGKKIINKSLCLTALLENSKPAPDFILEIIRCSYKSQSLCSTKRFSNVAYLAQCFVLASVLTELW